MRTRCELCPRRSVALEGAAAALEHGLIGHQTVSDRLTVAELLDSVEQQSASERNDVLSIVSPRSGGHAFVARLGKGPRRRLVRALRRLTASPQ